MKTDWLIVGAGLTGSVLAERIASLLGRRVLIVERRRHVAGNIHDYHDGHGILVHGYGPHIFHTPHARVWEYLSGFTRWHLYHHRVLAVLEGKKVPIPFNLNSIRAVFPPGLAARLEGQLVSRFGYGTKVPIMKLRETSDRDLKFLADYIYEYVFLGYTQKQWQARPEELDASVTSRVPVFVSRDDRYFQDPYQGLPALGYTEMVRRMLDHPNIRVLLNADYRDVAEHIEFERMIYTGPIDEFFDFSHGRLPYRSLEFELRHEHAERWQETAVVNYPNDYEFTRITEYKSMTGQNAPGTTIAVERPRSFEAGRNEPYYPIPTPASESTLALYRKDAEALGGRVLFAGRLGDYRYHDMDDAVGCALDLFDREIAGRVGSGDSGPA